jgi:hypothetical protein
MAWGDVRGWNLGCTGEAQDREQHARAQTQPTKETTMKKFPRVAVIERVVQQMIDASELEAVQGGEDVKLQLSMKYGGPTPHGPPAGDDDVLFAPSMKYGGPTHHARPRRSDDDLGLARTQGSES